MVFAETYHNHDNKPIKTETEFQFSLYSIPNPGFTICVFLFDDLKPKLKLGQNIDVDLCFWLVISILELETMMWFCDPSHMGTRSSLFPITTWSQNKLFRV